jgi:hypothetical protein
MEVSVKRTLVLLYTFLGHSALSSLLPPLTQHERAVGKCPNTEGFEYIFSFKSQHSNKLFLLLNILMVHS